MGYPTKKQSFYKEKDCFFVGYPKFFGPSYFEVALVYRAVCLSRVVGFLVLLQSRLQNSNAALIEECF